MLWTKFSEKKKKKILTFGPVIHFPYKSPDSHCTFRTHTHPNPSKSPSRSGSRSGHGVFPHVGPSRPPPPRPLPLLWLLPPRKLPPQLQGRRDPLREGELPDLHRHRDPLLLLLPPLLQAGRRDQGLRREPRRAPHGRPHRELPLPLRHARQRQRRPPLPHRPPPEVRLRSAQGAHRRDVPGQPHPRQPPGHPLHQERRLLPPLDRLPRRHQGRRLLLRLQPPQVHRPRQQVRGGHQCGLVPPRHPARLDGRRLRGRPLQLPARHRVDQEPQDVREVPGQDPVRPHHRRHVGQGEPTHRLHLRVLLRRDRHQVAVAVGRLPEDGGGQGALVLHPQLADGHRVPGRDRARHLPEDGQEGSDALRGARQGGAGADERGALGLEARRRGRLPRPGQPRAPVRSRRRRRADPRDGARHDPLRRARIHVSGLEGGADHRDALLLPLPRDPGRLRRGQAVEDDEVRGPLRLGLGLVARRLLLPRDLVPDPDHAQLPPVGEPQHGRDPVLPVRGPHPALVLHLRAAHARRRLPRRAGAPHRVSGPDQPDPEGNPAPEVPVLDAGHRRGHPPLRHALHRAVLHHVEHLDGTGVLRVRLPFHRDDASCGGVRRGLSRPHLHAPLRRGLEVVVEVFLLFRVGGPVYLPLLGELSRVRPEESERAGLCDAVPWIFALHGPSHHACHRHRRVPLVVLVRALPLLVREVGLSLPGPAAFCLRFQWWGVTSVQSFFNIWMPLFKYQVHFFSFTLGSVIGLATK